MDKPIDIFVLTFLRQEFSSKCIKYLKERTKTPYRLFVIDNGGNQHLATEADFYIALSSNVGVHAGWNIALSLAESDYFITTDPDLLVPDLEPDWLAQLSSVMDANPGYGAISLHPHIFIGDVGIDQHYPEDVKERGHCGAVMRIMRTEAVREAGGWEHKIEAGRNHEEKTICSRLQTKGWKVGITPRIRAYHMFGNNWGYPEEFTPEMQKHNPELKDYVKSFDNIEAYDPKTWMPK